MIVGKFYSVIIIRLLIAPSVLSATIAGRPLALARTRSIKGAWIMALKAVRIRLWEHC